MVRQLSMCAVALVAIGCGGKQASTTPSEDVAVEEPVDPNPGAATMVPPEKMDEINRLLDRRQRIVSRCLASAVDADELPANSRGKMTLEIVIAPSGKASKVNVLTSSLESKMLETCVVGHIQDIAFPQLPATFPTSYTYAFEAM